MQMLCWIDRITADFAVLCTESGAQLQLPAASLPQGAAERAALEAELVRRLLADLDSLSFPPRPLLPG